MCGSRVLKYADFMHSVINSSKAILSCGEVDLPQKVQLQHNANQKAVKQEQFWMKQAAESSAEKLFHKLAEVKKAHFIFDEFGTPSFISFVQKEVTSKIQLQNLNGYLVVLCGRDKATGVGTVLILSDSSEEMSTVSTKLSQILQKLKGGGGHKGGKWQGKVTEFGKGEWTAMCQYLRELN